MNCWKRNIVIDSWVDILSHMPVNGVSFSSCGDLIPSGHIGFSVMAIISILRELPSSWCRCIRSCFSLICRSKNPRYREYHLRYTKLLFYTSLSQTLYGRFSHWIVHFNVCVGRSCEFIIDGYSFIYMF